MAEPDDGALVGAAQGGDRAALDALLRRHHDRIHRLCRRMAGNEADALDATQEALIAIAKGIGRFDGRSAFNTWAYRVATNACLDELRRRSRRPSPGLPDEHHLPEPASDSTAVEGIGQRMAVDAALARLPVAFRAAVVLRDLCDLDYAEIAQVLDIPAGTVRSRIARGRGLLADLLADRPDDPRSGGNRSDGPDRPTPERSRPSTRPGSAVANP